MKGLPEKKPYTPYAKLALTIFNFAFLPSPGQCAQTGKCFFSVVRQTRTTVETSGHETTLNRNFEIQKVKRYQDICPKLYDAFILKTITSINLIYEHKFNLKKKNK